MPARKSAPNRNEKPTTPPLLPPPGRSRVGVTVGGGPAVLVGVTEAVTVLVGVCVAVDVAVAVLVVVAVAVGACVPVSGSGGCRRAGSGCCSAGLRIIGKCADHILAGRDQDAGDRVGTPTGWLAGLVQAADAGQLPSWRDDLRCHIAAHGHAEARAVAAAVYGRRKDCGYGIADQEAETDGRVDGVGYLFNGQETAIQGSNTVEGVGVRLPRWERTGIDKNRARSAHIVLFNRTAGGGVVRVVIARAVRSAGIEWIGGCLVCAAACRCRRDQLHHR